METKEKTKKNNNKSKSIVIATLGEKWSEWSLWFLILWYSWNWTNSKLHREQVNSGRTQYKQYLSNVWLVIHWMFSLYCLFRTATTINYACSVQSEQLLDCIAHFAVFWHVLFLRLSSFRQLVAQFDNSKLCSRAFFCSILSTFGWASISNCLRSVKTKIESMLSSYISNEL